MSFTNYIYKKKVGKESKNVNFYKVATVNEGG